MSNSRGPDFREIDIELLRTGNLADATVKCKGRTWKVHRSLLASRLKFFRASFYGKFSEATSREVDFPEADPNAVNIMLRHLYGEDIYVKDLNTPLSCVRCWKLADYVQLDTLKMAALSSLEDHFNAMALLSSGGRRIEGTKPTWWRHFIDAFQEVCSDISTKPLQATFVTFLWVTRFETLHQRQILDVLKKYPDVNEILLSMFVRGEFIAGWLPRLINIQMDIKNRGEIQTGFNDTCARCYKKLNPFEEAVFYNPLPVAAGPRIGQLKWCKRCVAKINEERGWPWRNDGPSKGGKLQIAAWSWSDEK